MWLDYLNVYVAVHGFYDLGAKKIRNLKTEVADHRCGYVYRATLKALAGWGTVPDVFRPWGHSSSHPAHSTRRPRSDVPLSLNLNRFSNTDQLS